MTTADEKALAKFAQGMNLVPDLAVEWKRLREVFELDDTLDDGREALREIAAIGEQMFAQLYAYAGALVEFGVDLDGLPGGRERAEQLAGRRWVLTSRNA